MYRSPRSNKPDIAIQPAWLKHDKQALRFYAYFQEHVVENPTENFRIRNVTGAKALSCGTLTLLCVSLLHLVDASANIEFLLNDSNGKH